MPYQYGNQANPGAHYNGTAVEILDELDQVAAFVAGLGTGGTLMGVGRRLKEHDPETKIVAAELMQGELVQGLRSLDDGFILPIIDLRCSTGRSWSRTATRSSGPRGCSWRRGCSPASRRARSRRSASASPPSSIRATSSSSSPTTAGSTPSGVYTQSVEELEGIDSTVWW